MSKFEIGVAAKKTLVDYEREFNKDYAGIAKEIQKDYEAMEYMSRF